MYYFGKTFTSTTTGTRLAEAACEKCGTRYAYELTRVGVGRGHAPYMLGQTSAKRRAAAAAERNLAARLASDAELVPCPACHWVDADAVRQYRRRLYPRGTLLAWTVGIVGGVMAAIAMLPDRRSSAPPAVGIGVLVATVALVAVVLLGRRHLRRRVDPNVTYPRWPTVPPGTPAALVEVHDPLTGQPCWLPAPGQPPVARPAAEGVTFRAGQLSLPPVCGSCLGAATTTYRPPMKVNAHSDLAVPLCRPCLGRLRRRWWAAILGSFGGLSVVAAAVVAVVPRSDQGGAIAVGCTVAALGTLFVGIPLAGRVGRPYRLTVVDAGRGVYRFAAANPAYSALLADRIAALYGGPTAD